jgi:hypothetical protein
MQNNTGTSALDIFDDLASEDLSQIDTSYPILAAGQYEFNAKEVTKECSDNGFEYILVKASLVTSGALDTGGNTISPGYIIRYMIGLTPADKTVAEVGLEEAKKRIKVNIVKFLDAVVENRQWDPTFELYVGRNFFAKTKVTKERTDKNTGNVYPPAAEIQTLIPLVA